MNTETINLKLIKKLTNEQFYQLCRQYPEIKFERNAQGELLIMSPTGGETGNCNAELTGQFWFWNRQAKLGKVFDSSTCFKLPNCADRSPDLAWIRLERWNELTPQQKEIFPPIAPDFVLELLSPSDSLRETQEKMQEYIDNSVQLGWLINRRKKQVEIYRLGRYKEVLDNPKTLSGEDILPGFVLNLEAIW